MKQKIIEFLKGLGTIGLYSLLVLIGQLLLGKFFHSSNKIVATTSQIGLYLILLAGLAIVYRKRLIEDAKNFKKEYIGVAFRNWILGLIFMMATNLLIMSFVKDIAINESLNRELLNNYPISNIITMIIFGPMIEEITFRLSFKNAFSKWYTFAITTALFFGLAHIAEFKLLELLFIIPYASLGFFFAKAMYETDNYYTSLLMHMTHNAMCVILLLM